MLNRRALRCSELSNFSATFKPIAVLGDPGAPDEWRTIIDASDAITNWVPAPSIGAGVWEPVSVPYKVFWMGVGDRNILRAPR